MSTSLARQLKRLAIPETQIFNRPDKIRTSLLFDPKEAANFDRETFFSIGINGLQELQALDLSFTNYEDDLFSDEYKTLERTIQTKAMNAELDEKINEFLIRLSPYFMLKPSLQVLEWLIYRFHINVLNTDALFACILPYHETNYFVRTVQTMDFKNSQNSKWSWLKDVKANGTVLLKMDLFKHASEDFSFLNYVCQLPQKYIQVFSINRSLLQTLFAFYTTTVIGAINVTKINEEIVSTLASYIESGLKSSLDLYVTSSYMILTALAQRMKLKVKFWKSMTKIISKNIKESLFEHIIVCFMNIVNTQNCQPFSDKTIDCLLVDNGQLFLNPILELGKDYNTSTFIYVVVDALIKSAFSGFQEDVNIASHSTKNKKIWKALLNSLKTIPMNSKLIDDVIKSLINTFVTSYQAIVTVHEGDKEGKKSRLNNMKGRMGKVVNFLDKKYPVNMEKALSHYMSNGKGDLNGTQVNKKALKFFVKISTSPKYMVMDASKTTLHLSLNHPNPEIRKIALETALKLGDGPLTNSYAVFLAQVVKDKLECEDDPQVLSFLFDICDGKNREDDQNLVAFPSFQRVFSAAYPNESPANGHLAQALMNFLKTCRGTSKLWLKLYKRSLDVLVNIDGQWQSAEIRCEALLLLVPHFFATPSNLYLVRKLSKSPVYATFPLFQTLQKTEWRTLLSNKYNLNQANEILIESIAKDIANLPERQTQLSLMSRMVTVMEGQASLPLGERLCSVNARTAYFVSFSIITEWARIFNARPEEKLQLFELLQSLTKSTLAILAEFKEEEVKAIYDALPEIFAKPNATPSWKQFLPHGESEGNFINFVLMAKSSTDSDSIAFASRALVLIATRTLVNSLSDSTIVPESYRDHVQCDLLMLTDEPGKIYLETLVVFFKMLLLKSLQASMQTLRREENDGRKAAFATLLELFVQEFFPLKANFVTFLCYAIDRLNADKKMTSDGIEFPYQLSILKIMDITLSNLEGKAEILSKNVLNSILVQALGEHGLNSPHTENRKVGVSILKHALHPFSNEKKLSSDHAEYSQFITYVLDWEDEILKNSKSILHIFSPAYMEGHTGKSGQWLPALIKITEMIITSPLYSTATKCKILAILDELDDLDFFVKIWEPSVASLYANLREIGKSEEEKDVCQMLLKTLLSKYSPIIAPLLEIGSQHCNIFFGPLKDLLGAIEKNDSTFVQDTLCNLSIVETLLTRVTPAFFDALPSDGERTALCEAMIDCLYYTQTLPESTSVIPPLISHALCHKISEILRSVPLTFPLLHGLLTRDAQPQLSALNLMSGDSVSTPSITKIRRMSTALSASKKKRSKNDELNELKIDGSISNKEGSANLERLLMSLEIAGHQIPNLSGSDCSNLLQTLFALLDYCVEDEHASKLEYAKQLILTLLLTILDGQTLMPGRALETRFKVESVLACLRASNDAQTQLRALDVLTCAAKKLDSDFRATLLHNSVALFTFMGQRLAQAPSVTIDDERSFDVITRTLEALLPALMTSVSLHSDGSHLQGSLSTFEINALQVFTDAAPDIPSHRRLLLFQKLISTTVNAVATSLEPGADRQDLGLTLVPPRLNLLATLLLAHTKKPGGERDESFVDLCVDVFDNYPRHYQLQACKELVDHVLYIITSQLTDEGLDEDTGERDAISLRYTSYEASTQVVATFNLYESCRLLPSSQMDAHSFISKRLGLATALCRFICTLLGRGEILKKISKEEERFVRKLLTTMLRSQVILTTLVQEDSDQNSTDPKTQTMDLDHPKIKVEVMADLLTLISRGLRIVMRNVTSKHLVKSLTNILSQTDGRNYDSTLGQKTLELLTFALTSSLANPNIAPGKGQKQLYLQMLPVLGDLIDHFNEKFGCETTPKAMRQLGINAQLAVSNVKKITTLTAGPDTQGDFKKVMEIVLNTLMLYRPCLEQGKTLTSDSSAPMSVYFAAALCLAELNSALGGTALLPHFNAVLPLTLNLISKGRQNLTLNQPVSASECFNAKTTVAAIQCGLAALNKYLFSPATISFLHPFVPDVIAESCLLSSLLNTMTAEPLTTSSKASANLASKCGDLRMRLNVTFKLLSGGGLETRLFLSAMVTAYNKLMVIANDFSKSNKSNQKLAWSWIISYVKLLSDHISNGVAYHNVIDNQILLQKAFLGQYLNFGSSIQNLTSEGVMSLEDSLDVDDRIAEAFVLFLVKLSERDLQPFLLEVTEWATPRDLMNIDDETAFSCDGIAVAKLSLYFDIMLKLAVKLDVLFLLFVTPVFELGLKLLKFRSHFKHNKGLSHLINNVSKVIHRAIIVDDGTFLIRERFTALADLLIDRIEDFEDSNQCDVKISGILAPLITDMVCGLRDDACWKSMNHSLLLKTKNPNPKVRVSAIKILESVYRKCGEDYLILLPESTSYIAELMEDDDSLVEAECHKFIETIEKLLGEPLQKYF